MQQTDLSYSTNDRYVENIWYTESLKKGLSVEYKVHINHLEENGMSVWKDVPNC